MTNKYTHCQYMRLEIQYKITCLSHDTCITFFHMMRIVSIDHGLAGQATFHSVILQDDDSAVVVWSDHAKNWFPLRGESYATCSEYYATH